MWIRLANLRCSCGETHEHFIVFVQKNGLIGRATKCKCGKSVEDEISWEDALSYAEASEEAVMKETVAGRKKLKADKLKERKGDQ